MRRNPRFSHVSGRRLGWLSALSPLWMSACGPSVPPLQLGGFSENPYPTRTAIFIDVTGRRPGGCSSNLSTLSLALASCGDECTVEEVPEGNAVLGAPSGALVLAVTAQTPGPRRLDVVVHDDDGATRSESLELEFADVSEIGMMHDVARDPGVAAPMLTNMSTTWCTQAFAADGRPLELLRSETAFEARNEAVQKVFQVQTDTCFHLRTSTPGEGHLVFEVAGVTLEHFPEVIGTDDVAEIHLHRARLTSESWLPLDEAGNPDGPEVTSLVLGHDSVEHELVVRLVTKDGRIARGGAEHFHADHTELEVTFPFRATGQSFLVSAPGVLRPPATCLRATIGEAQLDVPVYLGGSPDVLANPCTDPPEEPPHGTGGAGGAHGSGGAAGSTGEAWGGLGGQAP